MLSKVFKAYDVRATYPDPLNEKIGWRIGCATGRFLRQQVTGRAASDPMLEHVVVGRDMRPSAPAMSQALIEGLRCAPVNVIDVGMVDTSFIYFAVNHLGCCGGIMTTASHNPPQYIGYKISGMQALPIGADSGLEDIKRIAATLNEKDDQPTGRVEQRDLWDAYKQHIHQFLDIQRPLKVVVDASNGMAGIAVPKLFEDVPNLQIIPLNFEVTGSFVHPPNPLVAENMQMTRDAVAEHGADLGVCFDGDADRCMVVDEAGQIVGCDLMGAVMARWFLRSNPGSAIAYDLRSSKALVEEIRDAGGEPQRSRVGHVFMKKVLRESKGVFGAELSGHMYYRDNYFTDSGLITFASILSILSEGDKNLSELIAPMKRYAQSGEINFEVADKDATIEQIRQDYGDIAQIDDLDGITVDAMDEHGWWFNLRKSNTEPLLRLNMEARDKATLDKMYEQLSPKLGKVAAEH
jgi:phosphomannomutase